MNDSRPCGLGEIKEIRSKAVANVVPREADFGLNQAAIIELGKALRGPLLLRSDPGYVEACSIWNSMVTKQPALIARVSGPADVVACVNFARDHDLPLSIRGGGHNIAGAALCEGGLMIDMSLRRSVRVDTGRQIVRAEAGATWATSTMRLAFRSARSGRDRIEYGYRGLHRGWGLRVDLAEVRICGG